VHGLFYDDALVAQRRKSRAVAKRRSGGFALLCVFLEQRWNALTTTSEIDCWLECQMHQSETNQRAVNTYGFKHRS